MSELLYTSKIKDYFGLDNIIHMPDLVAGIPFEDRIIEMLDELSRKLLKVPNVRRFPDVVTFAFFIRRASIMAMKDKYKDADRLGRGVTFHIAPSNVPINFAYSLVAGLIAGNPCIVRVSSKGFEQTRIISEALCELKDDFKSELERIALISYEHDKEITDYLSSICNVRVIWGGDNTIHEIRKSPLKPRAKEICFADRYSLAVISANKLLLEGTNGLGRAFYNDTYLFDQNACTSPRLIYWLGDNDAVEKAKQSFWSEISRFMREEVEYSIEPVVAVDKLMADYRAALDLDVCRLTNQGNNIVNRIEIGKLEKKVLDYTCHSGSFVEYSSITLDDLRSIVDEKVQTISCLKSDVELIKGFILTNRLKGVDRVVPIGKTADFSLEWDGYNLIEEMTRIVK